MNYIDKLLSNYLKTFKVNNSFEFVTNHGNALKVTTYKDLGVYYVKFERISSIDNSLKFYQENYSKSKEDFKKVVSANINYLNCYA